MTHRRKLSLFLALVIVAGIAAMSLSSCDSSGKKEDQTTSAPSEVSTESKADDRDGSSSAAQSESETASETLPEQTESETLAGSQTETVTAEDSETETEAETETGIRSNNDTQFADADFGGAEFIILSQQDEATDFTDHYIDNEEITGEPINDAVIRRNQLVEEKYNVNIIRRSEGVGYARTAAQSGTVDFNVVYDWGFRLIPGVMDGIFYDVNEFTEYIDLSQEHWAPSLQDDLTVAGKMYLFTSDISMNRLAWASLIVFNKNLMDRFPLEYPYTYVENETWTYDKYLELAKAGWEDADKNGIMNEQDVFGSNYIGVDDVIDSSGFTGYTKDDSGRFVLDFQLEKLEDIYNSYSSQFKGNAFTNDDCDWLRIVDASEYSSPYRAMRGAYLGQDHVIMSWFAMDEVSDLKYSDSQFGVVPMPKYEESQEEYYCYIDSCAPMFAVMKQSDQKMNAIILDYMGYESQRNLLQAFYEQTIKTKRMCDPEGRDEKMLGIVRANTHYSLTGLYGLYGMFDADGSGWDPIDTMLSEMLESGNFNSVYQRYSARAQGSFDKFYDTILDLD